MKWLYMLALLLASFNSFALCFDMPFFRVGVCGDDLESISIDLPFILWVLAVVLFGQLLVKSKVNAYLLSLLFILSLPLSPIVLLVTYSFKLISRNYKKVLRKSEQEDTQEVEEKSFSLSDQSTLMIGEYTFNYEEKSISKDEQVTYLEPKMMQVLSYLIEQQPRVVSLEELHSNVWQNQIVTDTAIRRVISKLRNAFSDTDTKNPKYIKSQMKRGYQFIAEVFS